MDSEGVAPRAEQWGTIALTTTTETGVSPVRSKTATSNGVSYRTAWIIQGWGSSALDFWDDFSDDGKLNERKATTEDTPMASLAVEVELPPRGIKRVKFLLTWHFPNRQTWTPKGNEQDRIGNYYTTQYKDAWDVAEKIEPQLANWRKPQSTLYGPSCRAICLR